jgi:hypothetical protein
VDADTGFGNALNVRHTIRTLERAGASAVQLEDQLSPKRCGHFSGKDVVSADEMLGKIKAAVDARHDENLLIMARTDARASLGFQAAIDRAAAFIEAGCGHKPLWKRRKHEENCAYPAQLGRAAAHQHGVGGARHLTCRTPQKGFALVSTPTPRCRAVYGMQGAGATEENGAAGRVRTGRQLQGAAKAGV